MIRKIASSNEWLSVVQGMKIRYCKEIKTGISRGGHEGEEDKHRVASDQKWPGTICFRGGLQAVNYSRSWGAFQL